MIGGGPRPGGACSTAEKREREGKYIRWEEETAATESQYSCQTYTLVTTSRDKHWCTRCVLVNGHI